MRDHRSDKIPPSPWVTRFVVGATPGGTALDVACGSGRHIVPCLTAGLSAVGVDRDLSAVAHLRGDGRVELVEADLEAAAPPPFQGRRFDVVIVANYLWRPLLPALVAAVADDGLFIYETFAEGNARLGRPTNPDFLLKPGELIAAVRPELSVLAFEHVRLDGPARVVQRICAVGPRHRWIEAGAPCA